MRKLAKRVLKASLYKISPTIIKKTKNKGYNLLKEVSEKTKIKAALYQDKDTTYIKRFYLFRLLSIKVLISNLAIQQKIKRSKKIITIIL